MICWKSRFRSVMCEVAHTSAETGKVLLTPAPASARERRCIGSVMSRTNLWSQSVSRIDIDQRSREARLRFEQTDRLFVLSATVTHSWLRRLLYLFTIRRHNGLPPERKAKELLSDRWPSGLPMLLGLWLEHTGVCDLPVVFNF
jgi:hypothetical protein